MMVQELCELHSTTCGGSTRRIACIAKDILTVDMLSDLHCLTSMADNTVDVNMLALLDSIIDVMCTRLSAVTPAWPNLLLVQRTMREAIRLLLAIRQKYLFTHLYKDMLKRRLTATQELRVVIHTHSYLQQCLPHLNKKKTWCRSDRKHVLGLVVDGSHRLGILEILGCLPAFDFCGVLSDKQLELNQQGSLEIPGNGYTKSREKQPI